ncbi:MAG: ribonuclease Z [Clostridia bacterium]|nr:ribonuclease Z [Clostridia bacterium]
MEWMICVDDNNGVCFNERRQSRDRVVTADMAETAVGRLVMTPYTAKLFAEYEGRFTVMDDLSAAADGDTCVWEFPPPEGLLPDRVVVYRWNRLYPADGHFAVPAGMTLQHRTDFPGNSHETITKEIWTR